MALQVAMPIAHVTGSGDYLAWFEGSDCILKVDRYFNQDGATGLSLTASATKPTATTTDIWNLHAFTAGFLSFQGNSLVLRLPRELNKGTNKQYNSGQQFAQLRPRGPQLRYVVYAFSPAPSQKAVEDKIRLILNDPSHLGRKIGMIRDSDGKTHFLGAFLAKAATNVDVVVKDFLNGTTELFVRAGDVIGNMESLAIEISFLDSCGSLTRTSVIASSIIPKGRPLNPSYFLYLVRSSMNTRGQGKSPAAVELLTNVAAVPAHPLDFLLARANIPAGGNVDQALQADSTHPPKPLHATVAVRNAKGVEIADRGISIAALGDWHESRNAPKFGGSAKAKEAPVEWRNIGTLSTDTVETDYCKLMTRAKPGMDSLLPDVDANTPGVQFDHQHKPIKDHTDRVRAYWERYDRVFNAVAAAFEVPCELLVTLACHESGLWFGPSRETAVIAVENFPIKDQKTKVRYTAAEIAAFRNAADLPLLTNYAGLVPVRNYDIPIPWSGSARVTSSNALTWTQLASLIRDYANVNIGGNSYEAFVRVSPGMIQTLVSSARSQLTRAEEIYGYGVFHGISFRDRTTNIVITADDPPNDLDDLFSDWFGVSVDATGTNSTNAASVDKPLSRMKRALHDLIAGACHIKHTYNYSTGKQNFISDFDLPTVASAFNDGAIAVQTAKISDDADTKWNRLFALTFFGAGYPREAPKYFNAAVEYFNGADFTAATPSFDRPAFRLWRS